MDTENHNIIINNYKNNERVFYSCVLLKGTILTSYTSECNKQTQKNLKIQNEVKISSPQIHNNKFKSLIPLNLGENVLIITYCCYKMEFIINFNPQSTKYCVVPLYIVCKNHDGAFQAPETEENSIKSACDRISVGAKLIQTILAEKFHENGLTRKTFQLETDLDPEAPKCRVFHSKLDFETARSMKNDLWNYFGREIMESELKNEKHKYLAFISCTRYRGDKFGPEVKTHDNIIGLTEAHVALGGGGLAIFGTACLYTWPKNFENVAECFLNENLVDKTKFMDDSCYRGTLGGCFATTLGSVCHELCHTFDLGHTNDGIMGRGFDDIDKEFIFENSKKPKIIKNKEPEAINRDVVLKVTQNISPRQEGIKYVPPIFKREDSSMGKIGNGVFWTQNCTILLYYHRWFNPDSSSEKSILEFQDNKKSIYSTSGIRIVEIRDDVLGKLIKWWDFSQKPERKFFIPEFKKLGDFSSYVLIAEDSSGNILKEIFEKVL